MTEAETLKPTPYTVLVVDDEPNVLRSIERLLRREPYKVLTAGSAEGALAMLEEQPVHLVMADQKMPGMTGIELVRRMKADYPEAMRVVFTGYVDMNTAIDAINEGEVFRFMTKPWQDQDLKDVVSQALMQYELVAENRTLMNLIERQNLRLRKLNQQLEEEIAERTETIREFLHRKNREMDEALENIRAAQAKILRSERTVVRFLSSLSQRTPGNALAEAES